MDLQFQISSKCLEEGMRRIVYPGVLITLFRLVTKYHTKRPMYSHANLLFIVISFTCPHLSKLQVNIVLVSQSWPKTLQPVHPRWSSTRITISFSICVEECHERGKLSVLIICPKCYCAKICLGLNGLLEKSLTLRLYKLLGVMYLQEAFCDCME